MWRLAALGVFAAATLWATIPAAQVRINVRWHPAVSAERRTALEQQFHLGGAELQGANTWRYAVRDYSAENLRALVTDAAVADTHFIDRSTFAPEDPPANRTALVIAIALLFGLAGATLTSSTRRVTVGPRLLTAAAAGAPLVLVLLAILMVAAAVIRDISP